MEQSSLEVRITEKAIKLGFVAAGIAEAGETRSFAKYEEWLKAGNAADMGYLTRHAQNRKDISLVAENAHSVIVCAARYPANNEPGKGFSTYSRGRDYHTVIRDKLEELVAFLMDNTPVSATRICVDTAPVLEREWATRAGIGWRGKQGQIVNHEFGCCLLLGLIITDAKLQPSQEVKNRCGECTQCIDACPTGALSKKGELDARKCISYYTVEHKGEIPEEMKPLIGETVFGCDYCTSVCPLNKFGKSKVMKEFRERKVPSAEQVLKMDEKAFRARFKDSPVFRTGLSALKRNAQMALTK